MGCGVSADASPLEAILDTNEGSPEAVDGVIPAAVSEITAVATDTFTPVLVTAAAHAAASRITSLACSTPTTSGVTAVSSVAVTTKDKSHPMATGMQRAAPAKASHEKVARSDAAEDMREVIAADKASVSTSLTYENADTLHDAEVYGVETLAKIDELETIAGDAAQAILMEVLEDSADAVHELVDALAHLPLIGSAFKILSVIVSRAKRVQVNHHNCNKLMGLVSSAKMVLKAVLKKRNVIGNDMALADADIKNLCRLLSRASVLIQSYTEGNWLKAMLVAPRAHRSFVQLSELLVQALAKINLQMQLQCALVSPLCFADFDQQMQEAHDKVRELTGQSDITTGLKMLASSDTEGRTALSRFLAVGGAPMANVAILATLVDAEHVLDQITGQVDNILRGQEVIIMGQLQIEKGQDAARIDQLLLQDKIDLISKLLQRRADEDAQADPALPKYMELWWKAMIGPLKNYVDNKEMLSRILKWFNIERLDVELASYDDELVAREVLHHICAATGVDSHVFLQVVLVDQLMDHNKDGMVTRPELRQLDLTAIEYAKAVALAAPQSMLEVFNAIFLGYNWTTFLASVMSDVSKAAVSIVTSTLKMGAVIKSYKIEDLTHAYHSGSRKWLFDSVSTWLYNSAGVGAAPAASEHMEELQTPQLDPESSRMFLMLADAGMGKSVFSAVMDTKLLVAANTQSNMTLVRHFFKVGQQSAQGKVMVLCLAQQLAEQLASYAELLAPVAAVNTDTMSLTLIDTFNTFLLHPLVDLEEKARRSPGQWKRPAVLLLLLDALDEADHGGQGFEPVTHLIAHEFVRLPKWVKVIMTGRPQIQAQFACWKPQWISPDDEHNKTDMLELLRWRLAAQCFVEASQVETAAQLMWTKSKGQFVYVKYAFEELRTQTSVWTIAQLQKQLPDGLSSMFRRVLEELHMALTDEQRALLMDLLLPVLVVSREPLTVDELVLATTGTANEVQQLVRLLANLFPCAMDHSDLLLASRTAVVHPYHKSVVDWLTNTATMDSGLFCIDVCAGHKCLARAGLKQRLQRAVGKPDVIGLEDSISSCPSDTPVVSCSSPAEPLLLSAYALRHTIAHACQSTDAPLLEEVLHDLHLWEAIFTAGVGPPVLEDLLRLADQAPPICATMVADMIRWLRTSSSFLVHFPGAVWQLACDAPRNSCLAQFATSIAETLPGCLFIKDEDWPACLSTVDAGEPVCSVVFSPNGKTIASGGLNGIIRLWDVASSELKFTLEGHVGGGVSTLAFTAADQSIVSGGDDNRVRVWSLASGQCRHILDGHTNSVTDVAISLNGSIVVSASRDNTLRIWDLADGECKGTLEGHTDEVSSVALSYDGSTVVSGSFDTTVRVWDLVSRQCRSMLKGHTGMVSCVDISANGLIIVSGSEDTTIRVWDLATGQHQGTLEGHTQFVSSLSISPDSTTIVTGSWDTHIRVWHCSTQECLSTLEGHADQVCSVAYSPDGTTIVSGSTDTTIRVWGVTSSGCSKTAEGHTSGVTAVAISPDNSTLVSGSYDTTLRVWDLASCQCMFLLEGHTGTVTTVVISPDGSTIVSSSEDTTIRVWDLFTGDSDTILEGHTQSVISLAISCDNEVLISGSGDMTVRVWDPDCPVCNRTLEGHMCPVTSVAVSPDNTIAASGSEDTTVRIWDLTTGTCVRIMGGHTDWVTTLAICPEGFLLISGSVDEVVRTWDLALGTCQTILKGRAAVDQLALARAWNMGQEPEDASESASISDDGRVITILTKTTSQADTARSVYVLPPFIASVRLGAHVSPDGKYLCVFDQVSGRALFYCLANF